ncbi:MAG TPA: hydrogenase maturation nickel metallochaperone HypA [Acidobacteriota bacterium]|jgi:hydrogenase nickel incorporation protein HypA/HybF
MHELALAEGIMAIASDAANGEKINSIRIRVGRLQHVTQDSLQFAFELISENSNAQGARIVVEQVPARYRCSQCAAEGEIELPHFHCRSCSSVELEILSGEEILVDAVELSNGKIVERCKSNLEAVLEEHMREHHGNDSH